MHYLLPRTRFARTLERLVDVLTIVCGWWLIGISVATCVEMAGRKIFDFSLQGVNEIGGYSFAVVSAIGFSYGLLTRGHTRVDFFVSKFSASRRAALNLAATLTLAAMGVFAIYCAYGVLADTFSLQATASTPLATPLWIPQGAWFAGYLVFAVVALAASVDAFRLARNRSWAEINRRHGPQTLEEEIESEAGLHLKPVSGAGEPR